MMPRQSANSDSAETWWGRQIGNRTTVRRGFLLLLIVALVPLMLFGVGRSLMELERVDHYVEEQLTERAIAVAKSEKDVLTTARELLSLLAVNTDVRSGGILCSMTLADVTNGFAAYSNLSHFNADGSIACSSTQPLPQVTVAQQPWWPIADTAGTFFVSGPHWGTMSERRVLVAVLPMHTTDGRFEGVLTASIDLGWMQSSLRSKTLQEGAVSLVLDGKGAVLLSSSPVNLPPLDVAVSAGMINQIRDAEGRRWSYAVAPLVSSFDGRNALNIAYAMPREKLFSWSWWQAGFAAATPLIAVLLASIAIWLGTNRLVLRWLGALRRLAHRFAAGDYRARGQDFDTAPQEFRSLAAAFYRMGQSVERRDGELRAALEQQQQLMREVHHRVKNNLQVITSLLSMAPDAAGGAGSEATAAFIDKTRLRIAAISLVHRLLYEGGELSTLSSQKLLGEVCALLRRTYSNRPNIEIGWELADTELSLDTAVPVSLWLVEAVSNAMLHAFPSGKPGSILCTFELQNELALLTVAEEGCGFESEAARQMQGRGLRILSGIGRQLVGNTKITSAPDEGTTVILTFPLPAASSESS